MNNSYVDNSNRVSAREAATALDVPRKKVYRWVQSGRLVAQRTGRRIFIEQADIDYLRSELMAAQRNEPAVETVEPANDSLRQLLPSDAPTSAERFVPARVTQGISKQRSGQRELRIPARSMLGPRIVMMCGLEFMA